MAAKRHHDGKKMSGGMDSVEERRSPHYRMGYSDDTYGNREEEARRHEEMRLAGMIREDHSQIANLPQGVMIKPYPKTGPWMPEGLDDTISGVDYQMDLDDRKRKEHNVPKKV